MPLFKKQPFALVEKPEDLKPQELVFQIRFTKEIFRSYNEYLKRINFYRKRVWACKATGKGNLTYEEALVSEEKASERIQNIPIEYVALVLRHVQYSMLNLKDLVNSIAAKFQGPFSDGAEIYGRMDGHLHPCKIVKVIEDADKTQYEIEWLGSDDKTSRKELINGDDLTEKNPPFSKRLLKSFIKASTYRSLPWVLHDNLAKKHAISTAPPEELKFKISIQNGLVVCNRKRKRSEIAQNKEIEDTQNTGEARPKKIIVYQRRSKLRSGSSMPEKSANEGNESPETQSIKYPIDDLLVQPTDEDRILVERPSPCRDFDVPMNCVGKLLMVWDFCTSFGRLLNLSPFSLEDFENSICYKEIVPLLIVEASSAFLRLLVKDNRNFSMEIEDKKQRVKITQITWTDYLCDFLEISSSELSTHISTIKRGHYGLLDIHVKLEIFEELIAHVLETNTLREKLDEYIEEQQALAAARRDEALDEGRKRREEKERKKSGEGNHNMPNGSISEEKREKVYSRKKRSSMNSEIEQGSNTSKKNAKKQKVEIDTLLEDGIHPSKREIHRLMKNEIKESIEMRSIEQRKEFLDREIEKRIIRASPLGKDKNYCRYWFFRSNGRIFVESSDSTQWGYYRTKEELDALIGSLNPKGVRERALKKQLQKFYNKICLEIEKRLKEDSVKDIETEEAMVRRSTRVRAPAKEKPEFLKYQNKWKEI
ncbi:hypothetical protein RD792_017008 [Penstemon davidsonii]|uniref:DDT domain-containing protein n=1 Tax=Penstemon davidsonii TaxID=160366 RepID=A0ABR0CKU8_9LAMI|nr:hypothetical protein RD792_017008 [Penstemon davidsonii]